MSGVATQTLVGTRPVARELLTLLVFLFFHRKAHASIFGIGPFASHTIFITLECTMNQILGSAFVDLLRDNLEGRVTLFTCFHVCEIHACYCTVFVHVQCCRVFHCVRRKILSVCVCVGVCMCVYIYVHVLVCLMRL